MTATASDHRRSPAGAAQADPDARQIDLDRGFPQLLREISLLLAYEITRELEMTTTRIETPLAADGCPHA
jgi:hypothetical protein